TYRSTIHFEDLHATLRSRFEADQRAAPHRRILQRGIPQAPTLPSAASGLLFGERHHRCRGRPFEDHQQARTARHSRKRRTVDRLAPEEIRRRDGTLVLVRSHAHPLTRSHSQLRQHLLDVVRAGIAACDPAMLTSGALADAPPGERYRCVAAGKAARAMAWGAAG